MFLVLEIWHFLLLMYYINQNTNLETKMTLTSILILSFLLVLIQITIPVLISLLTNNVKLSYLFSSRDNTANTSIYIDRANRSLKNLFETLPIFIGLILLSIISDVDNSFLAIIWLLARIIYVPVYIVGINYVRTGIWAIALICLIMMSVRFL